MTKKFRQKTCVIIATVIMACFFLTGCDNVKIEKQIVTAVVIDKEYVKEQNKYGYYFDAWKGKMRWKFKHFPAEYNVTIEYEGITTTDNNQSLYDNYEIGDNIEVELTTYYDENNNLITEGFYVPSISIP